MPRTLFITNLITHYRLPLYRRLAASADVSFIAYSDGREWYWKGEDAGLNDLPARRLTGHWVGRTRVTPGLIPVVLRSQYDVCVGSLNGKFAVPVSYLGARLRGKGFVLWTGLWKHPTTGLHRFTEGVTRYLYRHADAVVTYGRHVSANVLAAGAQPDRVFVAPQAVDLELFTSKGRMARTSELRIGYVGRLEQWKGPLLLLEALAILRDQKLHFSARLVGRGELEGECLSAVTRLGLSLEVTLVGRVANDELPKFYRDIDVLVIPSIETKDFSEPWSLAVNEAMGCRVLVVASDGVGAVADGLVVDGVTARVFPQGDAQALADVLSQVIERPLLAEQLAQAGETAVQAYNFDTAASAFVAAIELADTSRRRGLGAE